MEMTQTDTSNTLFQKAVAFINQTSQHVFLTGKAGTGKTTFLKYIRANTFKRLVVLAPTGVAAINAGGTTLHSFFNLPFGTYIPTQQTIWGGEHISVYNKHQLFNKAKLNKQKRDIIRELDLIIIDEVSMVRADLLDAVDALLRNVRRRYNEAFGGVQMLFIGDMYQLPPVVKDEEWQHLERIYSSPFFFNALVLREAEPVYLELKKIYRQNDENFIRLLNNIRNNACSDSDFEILNSYYNPYFTAAPESEYITLSTHNYKVDTINQEQLDNLYGKPYKIDAKITGEFPEHAYPVDKELVLKEGAQIMFTKNDKGETRRYYNGKLGTIAKIDEEQNQVFVRFANEETPFQVELETWKNVRFRYDSDKDKIDEEELGTFTQYPIRLAWAVTIHKSQGLTFDRAIIDAGQSFAAGQVYVALSRLRQLNGLVLRSKINYESVRTDERIVAFAKTELNENAIDKTLHFAQQLFAELSFIQAFNWEPLFEAAFQNYEAYETRAIPEIGSALQWSLGLKSAIEKEYGVARNFSRQLYQLLQQGSPAFAQLQERVTAAASWFEEDLSSKVLSSIRQHISEMQVKPRTKKYISELKELLQLCERKHAQMQQCKVVVALLAERGSWQSVSNEVEFINRPASLVEAAATTDTAVTTENTTIGNKEKGSTKRISLELFNSGKTVTEIAAERSMAASTIWGHLIEWIPSGQVSIQKLLDSQKLYRIMHELKQNDKRTLTELKSVLGADFSYEEIRAGRAYWEHDGKHA